MANLLREMINYNQFQSRHHTGNSTSLRFISAEGTYLSLFELTINVEDTPKANCFPSDLSVWKILALCGADKSMFMPVLMI